MPDSKLFVKNTMLPHSNIHMYTWTSPDGTDCAIQLYLISGLSEELTPSMKSLIWKDWISRSQMM
jgi:hypothetical protein